MREKSEEYGKRDRSPRSAFIDVRRRLDEILAKHTKQDLEKVAKDTERDYFMSADEAKDYNLIDRVIDKH